MNSTSLGAPLFAPAAAIARFTLLEAVRSRVLVIAVALALGAIAAAIFLRQIAMTEGAEIQAAIIAAALRLCSAFLLTSFALASMVREWNDKGVEQILTHPLPRSVYVLGRFAGFAAAGAAIAVLASLPLLCFAAPERVLAWGASLVGELAILAAATIFLSLTLTHFVGAFAALAAFYVLSRAMDALRILASVGDSTTSLAERLADHVVTGLSTLLPSLGRMTQSAWLTDGFAPGDLVTALGQTVLYCALLLAAALVDFYRKNL